jgi:hypothetical protein
LPIFQIDYLTTTSNWVIATLAEQK